MWKSVTLAFVLAGLSAAPAGAHARLIRAQPRVGSTVDVPPRELRLQFSESLKLAASHVTLTARDGRSVSLGPLGLDPANHRVAVVAIPVPLAAGRYHVAWNVTSEDTHETYGDFNFTVGR